jgi:hypothetical protein
MPLAAVDGAFSGSEETASVAFPTQDLAPGMHVLAVRFRNSAGQWGPVRTTPFEVVGLGATAVTRHLAAAEYALDRMPAGDGTSLGAADGAFDEPAEELVATTVSTAGLAPGPHTLYIRARDSTGRWGLPVSRTFTVLAPAAQAAVHVAGAEAYFDRDPGLSAGQPLGAADGIFDEPMEELTGAIAAANLEPGWHTLYVRTRDSAGAWGDPRSQPVRIARSGVDLFTPGVAAAEYRVVSSDTIATEWRLMAIMQGGTGDTTVTAQASLPGAGLPLGASSVQVRMRDRAGRWGPVRSTTIAVSKGADADFNHDGVVDYADFFLFADAWGTPAGGTPYDLNADGALDYSDFFLFADAFGKAGGSLAKLMALAEELLGLPAGPSLARVYPNPFNASTSIEFGMPTATLVRLAIYNAVGQRIRVLADGSLPAGRHRLVWDGRDGQSHEVASGVYLVRLEAGPFVAVREALLIR